MREVFGYGIAHWESGKRLTCTGRKVYDSKSAAAGALTRYKKQYDPRWHEYKPEEFEIVALVPCYE